MSKIIREFNSENHQAAPYIAPSIIPIADRVVVQADVVPELTKGGIALPNSAVGRRASRQGIVVAVGPGALRLFPQTDCEQEQPGEPGMPLRIDRFPMQTKVGDRVLLPSACECVTMDPDDRTSELHILQECQLLAILP